MACNIKRSWVGGINQFNDPAGIDLTREYYLGVNVRARGDQLAPINGPLDITEGLPTSGNIQGLYGLGTFLILFINGRAYYQNYGTNNPHWILISSLQMSSTAERIYAAAIPTSSINFVRKAVNTDNHSDGVNLVGTRTSSPQGFIVMDGENQPWIIFQNGTARVTRTYAQWTQSNAEYVPIAIKPFFFGGILYCVGKDNTGRYNQIFRSVTGRPLDFMIAVDVNGDKISSVEADNGAPAMAYRVDFNDITFIGAINTTDSAFLVTTARNAYRVIPDYDDQIFAEPTFSNQFLFSVGAVNDVSVVDVLGDTTVVHYRGIRSFNGVQNTKFEGRNSPFNLKINRMLDGIQQTVTAATTNNNYAVYALQTIYGYGLLWFDMLLAQWVSLDLYPHVGSVKQFAEVVSGDTNKLFFYTAENQVFECFAGDRLTASVYVGEVTPSSVDNEHVVNRVAGMFSYGTLQGFAECQLIGDRITQSTNTQILPAMDSEPAGLVTEIPFQPATTAAVSLPIFDFSADDTLCTRAGIVLSWDTDAILNEIQVNTTENPVAPKNPVIPADTATRVNTKTLLFVGSDGVVTAPRLALNIAMQRENADAVIGLGNHSFPLGDAATIQTNLAAYWQQLKNIGKFYAIPGNVELDADTGEPFFSYMRQAPPRYFQKSFGHADLFFLNDGLQSDGTDVEPDNLNASPLYKAKQFQWLKAALAASSARFKLVCVHHAPRSSNAVDSPGNIDLDLVPWAAWGADAVISGHSLDYERLSGGTGLLYLNVGTGGQTLGTFGTPVEGSAARILSFGYARATVNPLSVRFEFVDIEGEVRDSFVLRRG